MALEFEFIRIISTTNSDSWQRSCEIDDTEIRPIGVHYSFPEKNKSSFSIEFWPPVIDW